MSRAHLSREAIDRLLRPRSVAIVGASPTPGALGASVLDNLDRAGYGGDIHLVNPKRTEIGKRPCVPDVDALPDGIDCVVLAIPRDAVLEAVRACARRKVGSMIIFSIGFAEEGAQGLAAQREIAAIADAHGMVVEGPNCLGMVNYVDGAPLTFVQTPARRIGAARGIAILSQSGALMAVLSVDMQNRGLDLSFAVSTGNEAVSGIEDYVDYMLADEHTSILTLVVEQFRRPRRFVELARRATAVGKRIVLLHPGKSRAARDSAATHTGAMAGDYDVMRTVVEHAGVVVVDTIEELLDVSELLVKNCVPHPPGGVMLLTESGAFKAVALDQMDELGLDLPPLSIATEAALRAVLPGFIPATNPLDLTAQALVDPSLYERTMAAIVDDPNFGVLVLGLIMTDHETSLRKLPSVISALRRLKPAKPVIVAALDEGALVPQEPIDTLRELGVPFFHSAERLFRALAHITNRTAVTDGIPTLDALVGLREGVVTEYESKKILSQLGIKVPPGRLAKTLDEAAAIAAEIGFPVVLKAQSRELSHKSDAGGVVLSLQDLSMLGRGWDQLQQSIAANRPGMNLDGVLVEAMGSRGTELIVGARNDPQWGPVLLIGLGGVLAEALHDVRLMPATLAPQAIVDELLKLKAAALLTGFRGSLPVDLEAVAQIAFRLGSFVTQHPEVREVEINPVLAYAAGTGAIALDALMMVGPPGQTSH